MYNTKRNIYILGHKTDIKSMLSWYLLRIIYQQVLLDDTTKDSGAQKTKINEMKESNKSKHNWYVISSGTTRLAGSKKDSGSGTSVKDKDREMAKAINAEFSDDDEEEDDNKSNWDEEEKVIHMNRWKPMQINCFISLHIVLRCV